VYLPALNLEAMDSNIVFPKKTGAGAEMCSRTIHALSTLNGNCIFLLLQTYWMGL
jgi:hypothetical protein